MLFDPIAPHDVLHAIEQTLAESAAQTSPDDFARAQLRSAGSTARLLATELREGPALTATLVDGLSADLRASHDPTAAQLAERLAGARREDDLRGLVADALACANPTIRAAAQRRVRAFATSQTQMLGRTRPSRQAGSA